MPDSTMTGTTTHAYSPGDRVTTAEFGTMPLIITRLVTDDDRFCTTCHCTPANPDHHDGTPCCPGPFYLTAFIDSRYAQNDPAIYAEHELRPATA